MVVESTILTASANTVTAQQQQQQQQQSDQAAVSAAASSLQLLLREDALLVQHGLTEQQQQSSGGGRGGGGGNEKNNSNNSSRRAFSYAAALLHQQSDGESATTTTTTSATMMIDEKRAEWCLQEVDAKLALCESLAVKLSRTSPESVAGHFLRLHGHFIPTTEQSLQLQSLQGQGESQQQPSSSTTTTTTLSSVRDRADRLERQSEVLEQVAQRVESSLQRGLDRMSAACTRLERVLQLSSTLKHILRLQFENRKLQHYDLDDSRDLVRAAASVSVLEDLLSKSEFLQPPTPDSVASENYESITVVEQLRPAALATARQVRLAAQALLDQHCCCQAPDAATATASSSSSSALQLGATLQVYYHLGELPDAVWKAVDAAHEQALVVSRELWNPATLSNLEQQAKSLTKGSSGGGDARMVQKKLQQLRVEAAEQWAAGIAACSLQVQNLQRILQFKTDPVSRQVFYSVVARAPIPQAYSSMSDMTSSSASSMMSSSSSFSLFSLYWQRYCHSLGTIVESVMAHDNGRLVPDVAALYPAARGVSKDLISRLLETSTTSTTTTSITTGSGGVYEDSGNNSNRAAGILGGSSILEDAFITTASLSAQGDYNPQEATTSSDTAANNNNNNTIAADSWTTTTTTTATPQAQAASSVSRLTSSSSSSSAAALSAVISSSEWKTLQGTESNPTSGFFPLQQAFVQACTERLCEPLQYMFPENVVMDEASGIPISSGLSLLPSKYDVQRFDENIRQELSLADPREGGGDLTAVTMIAECVTDMIAQFCLRARNAVSGISNEDSYLQQHDWSMTESLQHDRKVAAIMYTMATYLRNAPDKTFVAPYRPATSAQHEEAAEMCRVALQPALDAIDDMVQSTILRPLVRAMNRRMASIMAKMHLGVYMDNSSSGSGNLEDEMPAFCQKHLAPAYEEISTKILPKFPPSYASYIASSVASFSIYTFVSNAALVRPLGESARLHMTQDLADLELSLEQLVMKGGGGSVVLSQIDKGKPYAELRAVRQMLFWSGLEAQNKEATELAKSLLREVWIKDVRPSTILHYLFSFAPSLLSSPHHSKRIKAEDHVMNTLVQLDGSVDNGEDGGGGGEDAAWMMTMTCCDLYQQRAAGATIAVGDGDARIAQILLSLGPELLRRRRS